MPKTKEATIDPASDAVVLAYVGEGGSARNVPARDLTHNDVAHLAFQRSLAGVFDVVGQPIDPEKPDGPRHQRPDPGQPDQTVAAAVIAELVATGLYSTEVPAAPAEPTPETTPAAPAETPEV